MNNSLFLNWQFRFNFFPFFNLGVENPVTVTDGFRESHLGPDFVDGLYPVM